MNNSISSVKIKAEFLFHPIQIEKRNLPTGEWVPCGSSKDPESDIAGLEEGKKYRFRIMSVNDVGKSEPIVSKEITAEDIGKNAKI